METIDLQTIEIVSPFEQEVDFVKATAIVLIDNVGLKSWTIDLIGPTAPTEQLKFSHGDELQLKIKAVDGRTFFGMAFVKSWRYAGTNVYMTMLGTGPLSPGTP